ncbi:hypothetical protein CRE_09424 [Caenorhabditis remanei]|uniref:Uncharacterized protein n=1 Tax=Caenorhabditis remanei TaxID=31234 RepID=E3LIS0_CAERE|nr:hypothetical protein CRE_09424 [Caenorhabditis remanei]
MNQTNETNFDQLRHSHGKCDKDGKCDKKLEELHHGIGEGTHGGIDHTNKGNCDDRLGCHEDLEKRRESDVRNKEM